MISDYHREFPPAIQRELDTEVHRPKYVPADVGNAPKSAMNPRGLQDLMDHVDDVGLTPLEFRQLLDKKTQLPEKIREWLEGKTPNGLMRKIILAAAEMILREYGARPQYSLAA
jgi:hypothetical protein